MRGSFEYLSRVVTDQSIDIDDISNCSLMTFNDDGYKWGLYIKTELGESTIIESGPISFNGTDPDNFTFKWRKIQFSEKKLTKIINDFLNNPHKCITQAMICNKTDLDDCFKFSLNENGDLMYERCD